MKRVWTWHQILGGSCSDERALALFRMAVDNISHSEVVK